MVKGYLALVLHAHLPYVRHPESEAYLEERWLFEGITETYIPLLQVYQGLLADGVEFRVTMSITPTLLSMLTDPLLQKRYLKHLSKLIELAEKEVLRTEKEAPQFNGLAFKYLNRFTSLREFYLRYDGNLITAFRELQDLGKLEIITSAATHAFLPNVLTEEAIRAQLQTAVDLHTEHFGRAPQGIWLPECGFAPELDRLLKACGLRYFFTDAHGVTTADPTPVFGTYSPVLTPHGVAAFPRDVESSKQVWSSQEGYPGDFDYREYYRDIGHDLPYEDIKDYIHEDGIRLNTGIKYFRITGSDQKQPYNPQWAREKATQHAGNFLFNREKQVEHYAHHMGRRPLIVAPYDAELYGHWWYEGPMWLDLLLRKMHADQTTVKAITPSEYLGLYPDFQVCRLPMSSWGRGGYADVWLRGENDWIYPALHRMERQMVELANSFVVPSDTQRRALNQAARELMLAQSSDWAFIMDNKTMVDYAVKRTKHHVNRFDALAGMLTKGKINEPWLAKLEALDAIFPELKFEVYRSKHQTNRWDEQANSRAANETDGQAMLREGIQVDSHGLHLEANSTSAQLRWDADAKPAAAVHRPRVLMLSWEFPPLTIGGLSRHVYDLTRYLVKNGWDVHVVTTEVENAPHEEVVEGVHVHRVHVMKPDGLEFVHWAFQLNLMMIDTVQALTAAGLTFDLIHAHDWLVTYAAESVKKQANVPLVSTIHATEHGRNHGIHSDLQGYIHVLEWKLTYESQRVILCSSYMQREVEQIFELPSHKLDVIPNGVDPELLQPSASGESRPDGRLVMFVGRLVREKGVHTLLNAIPSILAEFPDTAFVIAGKGPAMSALQEQARGMGIADKVRFAGFISDEERNSLFQAADVAVFPSLYEPFGIVALEAMAAQTPVVVSDVGGLGDVVSHGHNGLKMYPDDAHSLSLQVRDLLRDPAYGERLAQTALQEIDRYNWNSIAQQTTAVYRKALGMDEHPPTMSVNEAAVARE
ncbi:1,4-alpha-glucan branching protein domain-containing protein [Tumebacillus permanentifrigoris]|uniref:1,4-alpha-glucan branching enzyme n=1 Tax=Tumebacillus permanentifrigoris TaxID=378543 RepID=A0A316DB57_9BACL|nr:1,4-alpha-glucan branching protein domain-containing protein [Tumebacillus permanentifrigoris]PWK13846.1 1,4-alpha-glucan branching enzyme [Tumebacillus permanentifrigoris]